MCEMSAGHKDHRNLTCSEAGSHLCLSHYNVSLSADLQDWSYHCKLACENLESPYYEIEAPYMNLNAYSSQPHGLVLESFDESLANSSKNYDCALCREREIQTTLLCSARYGQHLHGSIRPFHRDYSRP